MFTFLYVLNFSNPLFSPSPVAGGGDPLRGAHLLEAVLHRAVALRVQLGQLRPATLRRPGPGQRRQRQRRQHPGQPLAVRVPADGRRHPQPEAARQAGGAELGLHGRARWAGEHGRRGGADARAAVGRRPVRALLALARARLRLQAAHEDPVRGAAGRPACHTGTGRVCQMLSCSRSG